MPDPVSSAKLGPIKWKKFTTAPEPAETPAAKPVAKAQATDPVVAARAADKKPAPPEVARPSEDTLNVKAQAKGASGSSIKDQVARIDRELISLSKALARNQHELSGIKVERAGLDALLAEKLDAAEHVAGNLVDAREAKSQIQAEIKDIKQQIAGLDTRIGELTAEQQALQAREAQLGVKHRAAYDEAAGAENYAKYLTKLPESERTDGAVSAAQQAAASEEAEKAKAKLKATEGEIKGVNSDEAIVELEADFANRRKGVATAKGKAAEGVLNATEQKISGLQEQQAEVNQGILETTGKLNAIEDRIKKTERGINALEGKIDDLEKLRDEILEVAIHAREEDAKELMGKIEQLKAAIEGLKGDLKRNQGELAELKQMRVQAP